MGLLDRFLDLFNRPAAMPATLKEEIFRPEILDDPSAEAVEMKPVLAKLIPQLLARSYGTKLNELPAYQAIRTQDVAYQSRMVVALATAASRVGLQSGHGLRWALGEAMSALMRTTLLLTEADFLRLFACYGLEGGDAEKCRHTFIHFLFC